MRVRYSVIPKRPYSLARTAHRLARFEERVDRFEDGHYRRLLFVDRAPLLVSVSQAGPPSRARLDIVLDGAAARRASGRTAAAAILDRVLGTEVDVRPFYRRFRSDPFLGRLISRHYGLRVAGRLSVWDTLVQIVLSQQINLKLAHDMLSDLATRYGRSATFSGERFYCYPTPRRFAKLNVEQLRALRLSRAKASTLIGLAQAFDSGAISDEMLRSMDEAVVCERLTRFKGVGRWTAEFTLLRGLSRMDVFPAGDLGVVKYLAEQLLGRAGPSTEDEMRRFSEAWRPFRGLALIYAYAELG